MIPPEVGEDRLSKILVNYIDIMYRRLLLFVLLLGLVFCAIQPNIRIGLQKLATSTVVSNYNVAFKSALPTAQYNQLVTVGFIFDLQLENSIELRAKCPPSSYTQTGIGCEVTVNSQVNYANVVLSYFVSSEGNFLCGSATHFFAFPPGTTSLTKTVTTLVPVQPNSFKNANALQNYEYLAGVSSQDGNFALTFNNPEFEATNGKLDVEVSIEDMQAATLEVVIGYLIFDTTVYKIEAFENLQFSENWIQNNMLVAIGNVKKRPLPSAPARLLQTTPLLLGMASAGSGGSSISGSFFSSSNFSSSGSASEGLWNTTKGDTFIFSSNSSSNFSFSSDGTKVSFNYSSYTSTELIIELRRGSLDLKKIDYKLVQLNDKVYKSLMDADGIVDGSKLTKQQLASLYDPNALPPTPALTTRSTSQPAQPAQPAQPPQPPQTPQTAQPLQAAQPSSADATMAVAPSVRTAAAAAPSSGDSFAGQSNQIFNQLFSTNGFIIKSAASSIDSIYYFELTSLDVSSSAGMQRAAPAFFRSVPPPPFPDNGGSDLCQDGNIVMKMVAVDLIKRSPKAVCVRCNPGEVFSAAKRACVRPEQLKVIKKLFCEVKG